MNVALQKSGPCLAPALGTRAPWRHGAVFVIRGEQQPARAFYAYIGFLNGKAHPAPEAELPDPDIQPDVEPIGPCPCSYRRQAPLYSGSSLPRRRPIKRHSDFSILNLPFHARHSPVHPNWWTGLCFGITTRL